MFKVVIVDDHPIIRDGLSDVIEANPNLTVAGTASSGLGGIRLLDSFDQNPNVILIDSRIEHANGIDLVDQIDESIKVVILSTELDLMGAMDLLEMGVSGYLLKDEGPRDIANMVEKVASDDDYVAMSMPVMKAVMAAKDSQVPHRQLSQFQIELLHKVADGFTNKQISDLMFVTDITIKTYLTEIYQILQVSNRDQAIAVAVCNGII